MDLDLPPAPTLDKPLKSGRSWWKYVLVGGLMGAIAIVALAYYWYVQMLKPTNLGAQPIFFEVIEGQSTQQIAENLEEVNLIRNDLVFQLHAALNAGSGRLQTGVYEISFQLSTPEIFDTIANGETTNRAVAIIPGFTLVRIEDRLIDAGYSESAVREALEASYDTPVTQYIPNNSTLEGFLYPDTYIAGITQSPKEIIRLALEEMDDALTPQLLRAYEQQGLSVYEAVTLASIVQREIDDPEIQQQVAQVYLKRLQDDIRLDADPTFRYASELAGVEDTLSIDSPYNTRIYKGLPPGPIGSMTSSALEAVANPSAGDYLFFVTGDDGTTYFSRTLEEHERNVNLYCQENCKVRFD